MNTKTFADELRKQNREHGEGSIRVLIALFGVYLLKDVWGGGSGVYTGVKLFVALLYGVSFHRMYLAVITEDSITKMNVRKYLDRVIRPHAFPHREYFSYIRRKQIIGQAVIVIIGMAFAVMRKDAVEGIVAAATGVVPTIVSFVEQLLFAHRISSRTAWGKEAALDIWRGLLSFTQFVISAATIMSICFLGYAALSDALAPGLHKGLVIYRVYMGDMLIVYVLVLVIFVCCFLFRAKRRYRIITGILSAAALVMLLIGDHFFYIDTCPDRIVVSGFSGKKEYTFNEIREFVIYPEDEMFQVKVTLADGREAKLFGGGVSTSSESWDERYFSEYDYMVELAPLFLESGAKGEIREVEEMRESAAELNPQIGEALEKLIALLEEEE